MNIQILDSHLREFLKTTASAAKIAECLSLCGPSVDHLTRFGKDDWVYDIEITTNRIDTASVMGIAREAAAILPQFGVKSIYIPPRVETPKISGETYPLTIKPDEDLNKRVMACILEVEHKTSPKWLTDRLTAAGIRPKDVLVDITNYVMLEVGHPTHVFDYDLVTRLSKANRTSLNFRLSRKGEEAISFDKKKYSLPGNDIVIASEFGEIIDLPGIIGTANSVVNEKTRRIIFFIDNNDPALMRKTSLALNIRTMAVQLNEKSIDPELARTALVRGINLYKDLASGQVVGKIQDYYKNPYKPKKIRLSQEYVCRKIGVDISTEKIISILKLLGFGTSLKGKQIEVTIPSFRTYDVSIKEDLVEEIARIYGYYNLPSEIMPGELPLDPVDPLFSFENKIKDTLSGFGGAEVYTLSLVSKDMTAKNSLRVKNPLGADTEYLRTTLKHSLVSAAKNNSGTTKPFHLFEIANVYIPQKTGLPIERAMLAGVFVNHDFRRAKGVLEAMCEILGISASVVITTEGQYYYYELDVDAMLKTQKPKTFKAISKFPPQIEDMTIQMKDGTKVGDVISSIKASSKLVSSVELTDIFESSFTFRITYHDANKTLSDEEVTKARNNIEKNLQ